MIRTDYYKTRMDGVVLVRTYSDQNMLIERDGVRYLDAIDPEDFNLAYIETDEPIPEEELLLLIEECLI